MDKERVEPETFSGKRISEQEFDRSRTSPWKFGVVQVSSQLLLHFAVYLQHNMLVFERRGVRPQSTVEDEGHI